MTTWVRGTDTGPEGWAFDGWNLDRGVASGWSMRDGSDEASAFMGANTTVPSRAGEMWREKQQGPGRFMLDVWVAGNNQSQVNDNYRLMLRAMRRRHKLVKVSRTLASGEVIECMAEVIGTIAPTHIGQQAMRASITFNVPDGVWRSANVYTTQTPGASTTTAPFPRILDLPLLEPSTEANDEAVLTLQGPGTNWYINDITDGATSTWVKYNGAIPAGCALVLNCKTWEIGYAGSWTPDPGAVQYNGARYLTLPAARPGEVQRVGLSVGSGATTATFLRIAAPRTYAC